MLIINWASNRSNDKNEISINEQINLYPKTIKKDYFQLIEKIKNIKFKKKNVVNHSIFLNKLNLFNLGIINERSIYKSNNIFEILKIIALRKILKKNKKYKIINLNINSYKAIKILRKNFNIEIENEKKLIIKYQFFILKKKINIYLKQVKPFGHIIKKLFFKFFLNSRVDLTKFDNILISSTYHCMKKKINSNYLIKKSLFGSLTNKINKQKNLYLTHYFKERKSIFLYNCIFKKFSNKNNYFELFDTFSNFSNLFKSILIFTKFFFLRKNLNGIRKLIGKDRELKIYWELFSNDWFETFYGSSSFVSINYSVLFNNLLRIKSNTNKIFFFFENQNFEKIIIETAHNYGIQTVGIVNTSVRFWDLRYFNLSKNIKESPNHIITNKNYFLNKKFLLQNFKSKITSTNNIFKNKKKKSEIIKKNQVNKNILIVGDYISKYNIEFLNLLNENHNKLQNFNFIYKGHPAVDLDLEKISNLNIVKTDLDINKCLLNSKKSIFIFSTSAILEALYHKHETSLYICNDTIDFSPTVGLKNIKRIYTIDDVLAFIR